MQRSIHSSKGTLVTYCKSSILLVLLMVALSARGEPVVGEVVLYAGPVCPAGWLVADGSELDQDKYPELYAAVSTTHCAAIGGCSAGNFALPDLSGRFARGVNAGGGAGGQVGVSGGAAISSTNLPSHTHSLDGVQLSGRVVATTLEGDTEVPSSSTTLGDSNRTAIYKASTPSQPLADGSAEVFGTAADNTAANNTTLAPGAGLLPPFVNMQYCVASGGDTAPLIEVGLQYAESPDPQLPSAGELKPVRIDVSGFQPVSNPNNCFVDSGATNGISGFLCLADLAAANPTIGRPNIRFKLVGNHFCTAYQRFSKDTSEYLDPYPAELTLTGVQVSRINPSNPPATKADVQWGNEQFQGATTTVGWLEEQNFEYTLDQDEQLNYGFIAVDREDERTLVMEINNIDNSTYQYRVQAKCGSGDVPQDTDNNGRPDFAQTDGFGYYVYWDPKMQTDSRGGTVNY